MSEETKLAEEVATILYATRKLKNGSSHSSLSEEDLFRYILDWKKTWDKEDKKKAVASSIRHLEMLGWLKLQYSESLPVDEVAA